VLLDALAILKQTTPARLLVAGEFYEDEEETREEIQRRGLTEDVLVFNQYIPNEEVGVYFSAADIVVLPYLTATQSGILQIAYNFDRPVIVTDVGGLAESVDQGRTGYVVPPADPQALAAAIQRFFHEREETDFAANVAAYKRRFSWDRLAEAIEGLAGNERRR
jgi:D-inositol-3-phosphate glycosyltransferase